MSTPQQQRAIAHAARHAARLSAKLEQVRLEEELAERDAKRGTIAPVSRWAVVAYYLGLLCVAASAVAYLVRAVAG